VSGANRVVLGRVVGAHGVRGAIRVRYFGDEPQNLLRARKVALASRHEDPEPRVFAVTGGRAGSRGHLRLELEGIGDRDAAQALVGTLVLGEAAALVPLPPGEFYWHQLVGCRVEGHDGREIGTVRELWETGASDVLVVEDAGGQRRLIPAAESLLREVDVDARRIVIEVIPGLLDP
jgi:16S rRNA processing protein RimM